MARLPLTLVISDHDHVADVMDGRLTAEEN